MRSRYRVAARVTAQRILMLASDEAAARELGRVVADLGRFLRAAYPALSDEQILFVIGRSVMRTSRISQSGVIWSSAEHRFATAGQLAAKLLDERPRRAFPGDPDPWP